MPRNAHGAGTGEAGDLFGADTAPVPAKIPKPPTLYVIPPDARRVQCNGATCTAAVYWVPGRRFPISADCPNGLHPDADQATREMWRSLHPTWMLVGERDGMGISHFANCPDAPQFSGRGRRSRG